MQTTCVIHGLSARGESQVLGAVVGEPAVVKGAVQQYLKSVGPLSTRSDFADFVKHYTGKFTVSSCVPIEVDRL